MSPHDRLGDRVLLANEEETQSYDWEALSDPWFSCAKELEASLEFLELGGFKASGQLYDPLQSNSSKRRSVRWLLIGDNAHVKTWAWQHYPDKLIHSNNEAVAWFLEYKLHSASIDNWLFGLTRYKVISELSHFGRTAALRNHGNSSVFTIEQDFPESDNDVQPAKGLHRNCVVWYPDKPQNMMRLWYQL